MDQSDAKDLAELNQMANQTLSHVDATSIANHALTNSIALWVLIAIVIGAIVYFRYRTSIERIRLMQSLIEKGQPIPPELLTGNAKKRDPVARGIMLISIGLATGLFFWAMTSGYFGEKDPDSWLPFFGAFPLFIGIAYLTIGLYQRRHG
jgi:hypothetical protein